MSDIKKIIEEERRKKRDEENKEWERFRSSRVFQQSSSNDTKAEKLLSFADSALRKFSRETGLEFRYKGTDSKFGSCMACYVNIWYEKSFWGRKATDGSEVIIGLRGHPSPAGYISTSVLIIGLGGKDEVEKETLEEITEEWFIRKLAKAFAHRL